MGYYPADNSNIAVHGLNNARPGLHAVGEYQVAGRPFLKTILHSDFTANGRIMENSNAKLADAADEVKVSFPAVTSRLIITNNTNRAIAVYFCSLTIADGETNNSGVKVNSNFYVLPTKAANAPLPTLDIKVKSRYVYIAGYNEAAPGSGNVSIAAELTGISEAYDTDADNIEGISG